jgi:arginyl-tRNA synthetase
VGFQRLGNEEELQLNAIMHLFDIYVAINREAKKERENGGEQTINNAARDFFRRMENSM